MADNIIDLVQEHIENLRGNEGNISLNDRRKMAIRVVDRALQSECKAFEKVLYEFWECVNAEIDGVLDKKTYAKIEKEYQFYCKLLKDNQKDNAKGVDRYRDDARDEMANVFYVMEDELVKPFEKQFYKLKP